MIAGTSRPGSSKVSLDGNRYYGLLVTLPRPGYLVDMTAYLDGSAGGLGYQPLRGLVYTPDPTQTNYYHLTVVSDEVTVVAGDAPAWKQLRFATQPILPAGNYLIALHAGLSTSSVVQRNYIPNPSYEVNTNGWASNASFGSFTTFARQSGWSGSGTYSLRVTITKSADTVLRVWSVQGSGTGTSAIPVAPATDYVLGVRVNVLDPTASGLWVDATCYDASGTQVGNISGAAMFAGQSGDLRPYRLLHVPANTAYIQPVLTAQSNVASDVWDLYVDSWILVQGTTLPQYFDGDSPNATWDGTPHASSSTLRPPVVRFYHSGGAGLYDADIYSDGAANTTGPGATQQAPSMYLTAQDLWTPTTDADDDYLATLPHNEVQPLFFGGGPVQGSGRAASVGWHGTLTDAAVGSFAVVREGGPLEDLLGERVQVSYGRRSTCVYVHDMLAIAEDISLTRRSFLDLAPAAVDHLDAYVEILS